MVCPDFASRHWPELIVHPGALFVCSGAALEKNSKPIDLGWISGYIIIVSVSDN